MQFYSRLTTLRDDFPRLVIALGMFDGVHRGHRSIISRAVELAHACAHEGEVVLLSPACASFDMFRNYGHRAEVFIAAVRALKGEAA